ncbi:MAG: protein phosphatase 2C domain-containing protein [Muribaculaceae bacterium]|nr:protein phosphatase 2C domain-containing protein [Muribaculaceae bacterium]
MSWALESLWNNFTEQRMNQRIIIENEIRNLGLRFPNGTVRKTYFAEFSLPAEKISDVRLEGISELGLEFKETEPGKYTLSGVPAIHGDFNLTLSFNTVEGEPRSVFSFPVAFNPDPRSIWKDMRSELNRKGIKPDWTTEYVKVPADENGNPRKDIVAASIQGRSHAHEARGRDDHFAVEYCPDSEWYILAVADGAGSASRSWRGSEIACNTVVEHCRELLSGNEDFNKAIAAYHADKENIPLRNEVVRYVYDIVLKGAHKAHKAIIQEAADTPDAKPRDYATTLMFVICRRFSFGWFIASFWVGDGAMAVYDENSGDIKLLGKPDEGEFSGQTRFLTMPEIFSDKDIVSKRMRMTIMPEFTSLFLMSDGVSDPMFETDRNLNDFTKWEEFNSLLKNGFPEDEIPGVDLSDDNEEAQDQLLNWLKFWSPGNHDDRTLVVLH